MKALVNLACALALALSAVVPAAHAQPSGTITLYTSHPDNQLTQLLAEFAKAQPKVTVRVFRSGTTEVMNKLQAEQMAGGVQADVVMLADDISLTRLKRAGMLLPYPDAPTQHLPAALVDPDKTFFGTRLITTGLIYNTKLVSKPPRSWVDLLAPGVAAKTIMPSPLYSGAALMNVGVLAQQPKFGWKYLETLAHEGATATSGNGSVIESVARGEKAYGIIIDYMALNAKAKGSPVEFVFPTEGVTVISQPVAIMKASKNVEAAKAFVDWLLSDAGQNNAVEQGYYPAATNIKPPRGYPALDSLVIMKADFKKLLDADQANKEKFADLFGQ
ncbi:MAG: ABC transporter substrate-binding protein [Bordetella sp.]|uniref:ABC transporter substrate-binding protein n=1 Tax=Bordetella sp. TaxID=28081 RepID=UPI003F7C98A7